MSEKKNKSSKSEYVSVFERGDMSSPRYRAYLEQKQGLGGVYPEQVLAVAPAAARSGLGLLRKATDKVLAKNQPKFKFDPLDEARQKAAFKNLSKKEMDDFMKGGGLPADFKSRVKNSSAIGSNVGNPAPRSGLDYKRPPTRAEREAAREQAAVFGSIQDAGRRIGAEGAGRIAGEIEDIKNRKEEEKRLKNSAGMKRGGKVQKPSNPTSSASKRADGCATKGKTKCKVY
jgi:hypothetical protein